MDSPFDNIGSQPEWSENDKAKFDRLDMLYHKVFCQNEDGAELLEIWKEHLMMMPTATAGDDLLSVGMQEGAKTFIRNIITTIRKVEHE